MCGAPHWSIWGGFMPSLIKCRLMLDRLMDEGIEVIICHGREEAVISMSRHADIRQIPCWYPRFSNACARHERFPETTVSHDFQRVS